MVSKENLLPEFRALGTIRLNLIFPLQMLKSLISFSYCFS